MDTPLLAEVLLPVAIATIMCSLGLALTPADFRRVLVAPRGVAIGMLNLALLSPLLAFAMAELFSLEPELAVGLVLLGASPGGMMANMLTHLARGDTALSVTMTAISSVAAVITVPLFLSLSTDHFGAGDLGEASMPGVVALVFAITIIPVAIGMTLRQRRTEWVERIYPRARAASLTLFVLVVLGAIVSEHDRVLESATELFAAAFCLNVAAMTISFAARSSPASTTASRPRSHSSSASTTLRSRSPSARRWPPRSRSPPPSTARSCSSPAARSPGR